MADTKISVRGGRSGTNPPPSITQDDLVQASKAIRDTVAESLRAEVKSLFAENTAEVSLGLGKMLEKRIDAAAEHLREFDSKAFQEMADRHTKALDDLTQTFQKSLQDVVTRYEKRLADADTRQKAFEAAQHERQGLLHKAFEDGVEQIKAVLAAFRAPEITFTPNVHVDVPAPVVNVEAKSPDVVVNVPPAAVNVETKAPIVNVAPTPKRKKTFTYDDIGRPLEVTEEDVKE